jgi:hypothetical protein
MLSLKETRIRKIHLCSDAVTCFKVLHFLQINNHCHYPYWRKSCS